MCSCDRRHSRLTLAALSVLSSVRQTVAVCASGQMGTCVMCLHRPLSAHDPRSTCSCWNTPGKVTIGHRVLLYITLIHLFSITQTSMQQGANWVQYYSGFLMANNCGIISQNGMTQDASQVCSRAHSSFRRDD